MYSKYQLVLKLEDVTAHRVVASCFFTPFFNALWTSYCVLVEEPIPYSQCDQFDLALLCCPHVKEHVTAKTLHYHNVLSCCPAPLLLFKFRRVHVDLVFTMKEASLQMFHSLAQTLDSAFVNGIFLPSL